MPAPLPDDRPLPDAGATALTDPTAREPGDALAALARAEERARLALDAAQLGIIEWEVVPDRHVWDARARALYDLDPDEPPSLLALQRRVQPDDLPAARDAFLRTLASAESAPDGTPYVEHAVAYRVLPREGGERHLELRGRLYLARETPADGAPRALRLVGTVRDVTDRARAHAELAETARRFAEVLGTVQALGVMLDAEGRITYVNDFFLASTGWTREAVIGTSWFARFLPPDVAPDIERRFHESVKRGEIFAHHENAIVTRDGSRRTIAWDNTVLRAAGTGAVVGTASIGRDVTDERAAQADARRLSARFAAAVDASAEILWTNDPSGRMTGPQPGWSAYTGQTRAEYEGYGWTRALHPDDVASTVAAWERAVATRATFEAEHRVRRRDGAWRAFAVRAVPVLDPDTGALVEWVGLHRDVTVEREAAAAREALLAAEHAARAEVDAARARAEEANRAKSDFLANMSHELRTPLNAIGGYVQLLEMELHGPVTGAQRDALERVQGAQRHLLRLINDVLNYAKLEAGKVEYDLRAVRLADVVASVQPLVEPQMAAKGHRFTVALAQPDARVWADEEKLAQVLLNLLSNAVKFTARGGAVVIDAPTRADGSAPSGTEDSGVLYLRVADDGRGIPRDRLESIFAPFVQVDASRTRTAEGTGLGLAISRDLARGMGGELRARGRAPAGASFTVALRRAPR